MKSKVKIAEVHEFDEENSRVIAEIDEQEIAVFKYDGEFFALANYCIHQGGPLCEGPLKGTTDMDDDDWDWSYDADSKNVMCPWHGWSVDVTTGEAIKDRSLAVPSYEVDIEDGNIYVEV